MSFISIAPSHVANRKRAKSAILASTAAAALFAGAAPAAHAQGTVETVVVSSSRLTTAGFDAPTPTQVVGAAQIEASAYPSVFDSVAQLPALANNLSPTVGNGNVSNGTNGLSSLNARALGPTRTLVLIDGQRVAAANINGVDDIGLFPQLLIQRVDVVTGGASASYGSDAVAGVVNFITNTHFTGFKANLEAGITNYGDDANGLAQAAWGTSLMGDRLHIAVSGEYYKNNGVPGRNVTTAATPQYGPNGRNWYNIPGSATQSIAATPAGAPENVEYGPAQNSTISGGGIITSGPLKGTAFGPGGVPYQYTYGTNCLGSTCQGGELVGQTSDSSAWDAQLHRAVGYTRIGYDITPDISVYATASYGEVVSISQSNQGAGQQGNLTIQCGNAAGGANAYLPATINADCVSNNITTFVMGVSNLNFPQSTHISVARKQPRYVVGFDDRDFNIFGTTWDVNGYFQHGELHEVLTLYGGQASLNALYKAAIDAVQVTAANQNTYLGVPQGTIVCRLPAAQAPGCVPWNVFGNGTPNLQSWAYITNNNHGPYAGTQQHQEAASIAFSGAPIKNWAGDVSFAFGAEWRLEGYQTVADWYGNGIGGVSQPTANYPANPLLLTGGQNYFAGSFSSGQGSFNVTEGFLEIGVPLVDNADWGKMDADIAGRFTHYSTAGDVSTWKLGLTWDTPFAGIRLRAVASRDVRAPNLSELFPAPLSTNSTVTSLIAIPASSKGAAIAANQSVNVAGITIGNPALKTERAQNLEAGVVWQPDYIPGFQASIDYHSILIDGSITNLSGTQNIQLCQIYNVQSACATYQLQGVLGTPGQPYTTAQPVNYATVYTSGYDIGAAWQTTPSDDGIDFIPGNFTFSAKASHTNNLVTNTGIPNTAIGHGAGSTAPKWKVLFTESWTWDKLTLTPIQRIISAGYINPDGITCQFPNCPVPTLQNPTYNYNKYAGAVYFDLGGSYQLTPELTGYFKMENIANHNPSYGAPMGTFDWLGRVYRVGIRVKM